MVHGRRITKSHFGAADAPAAPGRRRRPGLFPSLEPLEERALLTSSFEGLGANTGATAVSADGTVVVGGTQAGGITAGETAFYWTQGNGLVYLLNSSGNRVSGIANAVSGNGSIIVGRVDSSGGGIGSTAFEWANGVAVPLAQSAAKASSANSISQDSSIIAGDIATGDVNTGFNSSGFTLMGTTIVTFPPSNLNLMTSGTIMSANGSVAAGNIEGGLGISTPYQWNGALVPWPGGTTYSNIAKAVSPDGSVVVGSMGVNGSGDTYPFEWTNDSVTSLTLPAGFVVGSAMGVSSDVSNDGPTIVGAMAPFVIGQYAEGGTAFIWNQASGIQNLQQVLTADYGLGSSLTGWTLTEATAITPDGNTIVGTGIDPKGATEGWIATLGPPPPPGGPITPAIAWPSPANIVYGTTLSAAELDASANVPGTYTYSPPTNTLLHAGNGQTLSVTFTPNDTTDYITATATVTINVLRAVPEIVWPTPANIVYGAPLGTAQLDATASSTVAGVFTSVPGTFTYSRPQGDILMVGNNQQLSASFAPADTTDYTNATATVSINVVATNPGGPTAGPRHTRVVLTAKPLSASVGRAVKFTASVEVRDGGSGKPIGDVVFQDSQSVLGTIFVSGHKVSLETSSLPPGRDTIQAYFVGTPPFLNSAARVTVRIRVRRLSKIASDRLRTDVGSSPARTSKRQSKTWMPTSG
jgi:uncharacterized membrane protein